MTDAQQWLADAVVDPTVMALRPDYAALIVAADGLQGGPSDETSESHLAAAEQHARAQLAGRTPDQLPHVVQWREAFRAFGAKPQRTRPSVEALLRRCATGLPRVDRITDVYNAVSVLHVVPVGGEDRAHYAGPPRLTRATGAEPFEVTVGGAPAVEHPDAGEVVWRDRDGVTCRRWNWRQCARTRITHDTTSAVFILDGLSALGPAGLVVAADALESGLARTSPGAVFARRLISTVAGT